MTANQAEEVLLKTGEVSPGIEVQPGWEVFAIVEDEGLTVLQLRYALRRAGIHVVVTAPNGKEGVETVLREKPDLVLMDINMPVMNGFEAIEQILAEFCPCIIILTAYSEQEYRQQAQELGLCGCLTKPTDSMTLLPRLEAMFQQWQQQQEDGAPSPGS